MAALSPKSFLDHRRLAVVGVSRDPKSFSRALFHELVAKGYDVVPVNPAAGSVEGVACVASVRDVHPPVEGAILLTPASATADAVRDCSFAGIRRVWLHQGIGPGAASDEALEACREHGLETVTGFCPFMFLPGSAWIHRAHGWWRGHRHGNA
jgi:predicted CoA-binding protein